MITRDADGRIADALGGHIYAAGTSRLSKVLHVGCALPPLSTTAPDAPASQAPEWGTSCNL
jgi:hypothetical protein